MKHFILKFYAMLLISVAIPSNAEAWMCQYVQAISGDTIVVDCRGEQIIVRLYGIDAPDLGMKYHEHSRAILDKIMTTKQTYVVGQSASKKFKDQYGRHVALVYKDGICINEEMVKQGYAFVYEGNCAISLCNEWKSAEVGAEFYHWGLWTLVDEKPWDFRAKRAHLAQKDRGYFEDIYYYTAIDDSTKQPTVVASDTDLPRPKFYIQPEPEKAAPRYYYEETRRLAVW
jgi:endonuclease YncB( thermonuclease family)